MLPRAPRALFAGQGPHPTNRERVRTLENPTSGVDYLLDRNRIEMIEKNKSILLSIIKVVITCARQNIALRGHRGKGGGG